MLPFQIIGEFSRTGCAANASVGNIMSGSLDHSYPFWSIVPVLYPGSDAGDGLVFGSDSGLVFAVLSLVYIFISG